MSMSKTSRRRGGKGRFIVIEGIDGSGTTTQTRLLVERLRTSGFKALSTREPSDGPIGVLIRQILMGRVVARPGDGSPQPMDPSAVALLFASDRLDHLRGLVLPALDEDVIVVSDRYVLSSLAYQTLDEEPAWVRAINSRARTPDLTLFLDVPATRAAERRAGTRAAEERFERMATQRRVARSYRSLVRGAEGLGEVVRLNGAMTEDRVATAIWDHVAPILPLERGRE